MIDVHLMRLRFEILNISLADISDEAGIPLTILEKEALAKGWEQWWPDTDDLMAIAPTAPSLASLDESPLENLPDDLPIDLDEMMTPLEEGSQKYIKETNIRLQVFNLAKDVYLSHKAATFENDLIDRAKTLVSMAATPQEMNPLVNLLKTLMTKSSSGLSINENDDGLPTVIIKNLTGRY